MVRTKREYILGTCILSTIAVALNLTALGTQQWVVSEVELTTGTGDKFSSVNYGLFGGVYEQVLGATTNFELITTCLYSKNVCAMLCGMTSDDRTSELEKLYNKETVTFDSSCPKVTRMYDVVRYISSKHSWPLRASSTREFLNAGIWLSTIIFLILSALFGLVSAVLAMWNTVSNPIEIYFNVFGLYIYNAVAAVASLLVVILWGSLFGSILVDNVGILHTISGEGDSSGLANLGYSYWLNLVSSVLYASSVLVLYIRQYLVNQEPVAKNIEIDDGTDPNIYLY